MWRHIAANALTLFIVALFLGAGLVAWGTRQWTAAGPLEDPICLRVPTNGTMREVSRELADQGAIASPEIFRIGADYADKADLLKAGSFLVPERASMRDIVDLVTRGGASTCGTEVVFRVGVTRTVAEVNGFDAETGDYAEAVEFDPLAGPAPPEYAAVRDEPDTAFRVVVAEGTTAWQVVQALDAIDVLDGEETPVPPEGSLAPRDYPIIPGTPVAALLDQMAEAQAATLADAWAERAADLPIGTPEEALTLASIVEKETGVAEERAQVASVFVNRLNEGMRLQTDPTVIYGITRGEGVLGRGLRQSELEGRTDWNTYVIDGLPPTPIANPGEAAIRAALNPADTDFLYFVADGTGGHAFATTLEEHNANVARWREIEAQAAAAAPAEGAPAATP